MVTQFFREALRGSMLRWRNRTAPLRVRKAGIARRRVGCIARAAVPLGTGRESSTHTEIDAGASRCAAGASDAKMCADAVSSRGHRALRATNRAPRATYKLQHSTECPA